MQLILIKWFQTNLLLITCLSFTQILDAVRLVAELLLRKLFYEWILLPNFTLQLDFTL